MALKISTVQMKFSGDVNVNLEKILDYIGRASEAKSDIIHFSEAALTGYAGSDIESNDGINWELVHKAIDKVCSAAKQRDIHVVLGTAYPRGDGLKPCNSLLLINHYGIIQDRYDKMFCNSVWTSNTTRAAGDWLVSPSRA